MPDEFVEFLKGKPDIESFVEEIIGNPELIPRLISIIKTEKSSVKFYCEKTVRLVSEKRPELVYPYYDDIAALLDSENSFLKWGGIITLSNLAASDDEGRFKRVSKKYFGLLHSDAMVTAANVAGSAYKFVEKDPGYEKLITREMLKVPGDTYLNKGEPSPECSKIMMGNIIDYFDKVYDISKSKKEMIEIAESQVDCSRKKVAKKARDFLEKHRP
ncbi:MAG: hypothetical protein H6Q58_720 [Firmicutes bacterium]|nr:hypothetical protein [Bacillota bacterium]